MMKIRPPWHNRIPKFRNSGLHDHLSTMSISRLDLTTSWLIAGAGGRRVGVVGSLAVAAIFLAAVALPLATYTAALAMFGLAHVGSELRYVDYRFGSRLPGGVAVSIWHRSQLRCWFGSPA
jgi:hypothetical protein